MKFTGKLVKGTKILKTASRERDWNISFHSAMEESLIGICRDLDIPVPLWLKKNTGEFAAFKRTSFDGGQFTEQINFDRFEFRMEEISK